MPANITRQRNWKLDVSFGTSAADTVMTVANFLLFAMSMLLKSSKELC